MAKIADLLAQGRTSSFEFFPPKSDAEQASLVRTLRDLEPLEPSFVSVTYRGGRASRERTVGLVAGMLKTTSLTPMAHLTCVAHTRLELAEVLVELRRAGIENLMALGGDPVPGDETEAELHFASELVDLARAIGGFSIGVAAHPQVHPRSTDRAGDRERLAEKLERADFAVTQFFWRIEDYVELVGELADVGCTKPILPGLMPLTNPASASRMAMMGGPVHKELLDRFVGVDPIDYAKVGIEHMTGLCRQLLAAGAPGLHFYTLNQSSATREIYERLGLASLSVAGGDGGGVPADGGSAPR